MRTDWISGSPFVYLAPCPAAPALLAALWLGVASACSPIPAAEPGAGGPPALGAGRAAVGIDPGLAVSRIPPMLGRIEGALPEARRQAQALTSDVANGATVSLIETATGKTVSTAVSSADGTFGLTFPADFVPEGDRPYCLEAVKGLPVGGAPNRAGAAIARVRTLVAYRGGWVGLTGSEIVVGRATTALTIAAGYLNLATGDLLALFGKLSGTAFSSAGTAIAEDDYTRALELVTDALADDRDPVGTIGFVPAGATARERLGRTPGHVSIHAGLVPAVPTRGATVKVGGQGLPVPGPATPSVRIGSFDVSSWSVNATRDQFTLTVPAGAFGGILQVSQGAAAWFGPFVPVSGTVGTVAGNGRGSFADGPGPIAMFDRPTGLAIDADGTVYVADYGGCRIRRISPTAEVSTLAGNGTCSSVDGRGAAAGFRYPMDVAVDRDHNVYVIEQWTGNRVRKIVPDGTVTTLAGEGTEGYADGAGSAARFSSPGGIAVDGDGNIFVGDSGNHRIRKISPAGMVTTYAGSGTAGHADGLAASARFDRPGSLVLDGAGNLIVADRNNYRIRKISPAGAVTTLAGNGQSGAADGTGTAAQLGGPQDLAIDAAGYLYVAEDNIHRIRRISPAGVVTTPAGSTVGYQDGDAGSARFNRVYGVAAGPGGLVYASDLFNHRVRAFAP